jgi:hypothetical protein
MRRAFTSALYAWRKRSQFLYALCELEVDQRQIAQRQRLLRDAHQPWQKGLNGFDHQDLEAKHWQELQVLSRSHTWVL